ncbi:MAG: hypothetical protein ACREP4_06645 [Stenotrophomonas sp.]|uniref:hypothetical protein n=1 Tax=Stenotrophomonas sp. TaxID=69392 RepID=UPI003D6D032E
MSPNQQIRLKPIKVRSTGRFRPVVHTGHVYDRFGNIVQFGRILREAPFGRNKITLPGFARLLQGTASTMVMVAGQGNTPPQETDTVLASYKGKTATVVSQVTTRSTIPNANNEVYWRTVYRMTFGPGSLGGGNVNVAEAAISFGTSLSGVGAGTQVGARGLLVDASTNPTAIAVNNAVEYLDIIWEYTEWVPASVTGTVSLTIDGTPTNFDYEVRPYYFDNLGGSYNYAGWGPATNLVIPGYSPNAIKSGYGSQYASNAAAGPIGAITGDALRGPPAANIPFSMTTDAYVANSKQRTFRMTWLPLEGNIAGGIGLVHVNLGHSDWQIGFTPKIPKISTKQLDLLFTYAMANRP